MPSWTLFARHGSTRVDCGSFPTKAQAVRARNRTLTKLKVPVTFELVEGFVGAEKKFEIVLHLFGPGARYAADADHS